MRPKCHLLLFSCLVILQNAMVMAQAPIPCAQLAGLVLQNTLYLHGGSFSGEKVFNQLFSLSLSAPFTIASPPWVNLSMPTTPPYNSRHTAAPTADGTGFLIFGQYMYENVKLPPLSFASLYNTSTKLWSHIDLPNVVTVRQFPTAVTDPRTGLAYIFGGMNLGETVIYSEMNVFNTGTLKWSPNSNSTGAPALTLHHAVWIQGLSAMVVVGGQYQDGVNRSVDYSSVWVYTPDSFTWRKQPTTGVPPSPRIAESVTATDDGRIFVYAGWDYPGFSVVLNDLSVLDTTTWSWTQPTTLNPPAVGRSYHTAVFGGGLMFVLLGNVNTYRQIITPAAGIIALNVTDFSWTTTFSPAVQPTISALPAVMGVGTNTSTSTTALPSFLTDQSPPLSTGALIGIVAAGVLVLGAIIACIICVHLKKRFPKTEEDQQPASGYSSPMGSPRMSVVYPPTPVMPSGYTQAGYTYTTHQYPGYPTSPGQLAFPNHPSRPSSPGFQSVPLSGPVPSPPLGPQPGPLPEGPASLSHPIPPNHPLQPTPQGHPLPPISQGHPLQPIPQGHPLPPIPQGHPLPPIPQPQIPESHSLPPGHLQSNHPLPPITQGLPPILESHSLPPDHLQPNHPLPLSQHIPPVQPIPPGHSVTPGNNRHPRNSTSSYLSYAEPVYHPFVPSDEQLEIQDNSYKDTARHSVEGAARNPQARRTDLGPQEGPATNS